MIVRTQPDDPDGGDDDAGNRDPNAEDFDTISGEHLRLPNVPWFQRRGRFRVPRAVLMLALPHEARKRRAGAGPRPLLTRVRWPVCHRPELRASEMLPAGQTSLKDSLEVLPHRFRRLVWELRCHLHPGG